MTSEWEGGPYRRGHLFLEARSFPLGPLWLYLWLFALWWALFRLVPPSYWAPSSQGVCPFPLSPSPMAQDGRKDVTEIGWCS